MSPGLTGRPPGCDDGWVTYLLISPTRSSIAGFARQQDVADVVRWHNGEAAEPPSATEALRLWRLAELRPLQGEAAAKAKAWRVAERSGFRARLAALRDDEVWTSASSLGGFRADFH